MSNERIKRDQNKIIIASHHAFNNTLNSLDFFDIETYGIFYNKSAFAEEIMRDYEKVYKLFKEKNPHKVVTILDKALCLGMVLRKYDNFGCIRKASAPRRIKLINERYIAEFMMAIIHYSKYSVRAPGKGNGELIPPTPFDLKALYEGYEEVLEHHIRELMVVLGDEEYRANDIMAILTDIYNKAILYGNGFPEEEFERTKKRIRVKESNSTTSLVSEAPFHFECYQECLKKSVRR